jgi:hypothetical protein
LVIASPADALKRAAAVFRQKAGVQLPTDPTDLLTFYNELTALLYNQLVQKDAGDPVHPLVYTLLAMLHRAAVPLITIDKGAGPKNFGGLIPD